MFFIKMEFSESSRWAGDLSDQAGQGMLYTKIDEVIHFTNTNLKLVMFEHTLAQVLWEGPRRSSLVPFNAAVFRLLHKGCILDKQTISTMIQNIQNWLLKVYWINSTLNNGKRLYFNKIFFPQLINSVNHHFKISKHFNLRVAFQRSPVRGLINTIFDSNEKYFNSLDLAVALNIAINGYCNEKYVNNDKIADSANYICELLKSRLYEDKILNEYLKEIDREPRRFDYNVDRKEIESVLADKILIFKTYFGRFNKEAYSTGVRIYHSAKDESWIDWKEENSLIINHDLIRFREGFFLVGFDYRILGGARLTVATTENGFEYFNPEKFEWGKNVIWAS